MLETSYLVDSINRSVYVGASLITFRQVIIITHAHKPQRHSVRYLSSFLKVYHIPLRLIPPTSAHATLPNLFLAFPLLRQIFIRERIQVVHSHVALSALGLEAILHARTMGLKAVFTDHSLLGLAGFGEMWGNKMLKACLSDIDGVICVSHTGFVDTSLCCRCFAAKGVNVNRKENTVLRATLNPNIVHVIPSAVVASDFKPSVALIDPSEEGALLRVCRLAASLISIAVTIICMSRLVYRKGIDLLIGALPTICSRYSKVRFVIGKG